MKYRSIDSSWDHTDVIFLDEGENIVPIKLENNKHKYTIYILEKTIENRRVFENLGRLEFKGQVKLQIPDQDEVYYGWFHNNKLHREDGPAFVKMNSQEVLSVQWLIGGQFNEDVNDKLVCLDRLGDSIKFFYRFGLKKFQVIRSDSSSSSMADAPEELKEIVQSHHEIDFRFWNSKLNAYNPELYR
jgi:hypothetical protein